MTNMFYYLFAPEGMHTTWKENVCVFLNVTMQGPFFLATPVNQINKTSEVPFQNFAANLVSSNK